MRVALVHNPKSGDDDHEGEHLVELITRAGHDVRYHHSGKGWEASLDWELDLLVVAGGDGTVSEVARETADRSIPMAILPTGTANNIAGWLGLCDVPVEALVAGWSRGTRQPFDLGVARGPWGTFHFLESIGVGLLAELMAEIDEGASGYVNELSRREHRIKAALGVLDRVLRRSNGIACDILLDDRRLSGEYLLVEVLNFGAAGPNLELAPVADCGDGLLDVVLVEAHERALLEEHLAAVRSDARHVPPLPIYHARQVTLDCAPSWVHLDDELWSDEKNGTGFGAAASLRRHALTFLVPHLTD
jgi:diacylglycerol kinase family enzyme